MSFIRIIFALSSLPLWSAQFAVLRSGFHLPFDRAERVNVENQVEIRLFRNEGIIVLREQDIAEWIHEPDVVSPDPPAVKSEASLSSQPVAPPQDVQKLLAAAADAHGLPRKFVASVARTESALRPDAVSPKGALGVMQLMPGTAKALGVDPRNVSENIEGGTRLLRDLLIQYQDDPDQVRKALAAYNAGAGAVKRYNGVPPYRETQNYVQRVLKHYQGKTN